MTKQSPKWLHKKSAELHDRISKAFPELSFDIEAYVYQSEVTGRYCLALRLLSIESDDGVMFDELFLSIQATSKKELQTCDELAEFAGFFFLPEIQKMRLVDKCKKCGGKHRSFYAKSMAFRSMEMYGRKLSHLYDLFHLAGMRQIFTAENGYGITRQHYQYSYAECPKRDIISDIIF
ncbi:MAG: hypothetical protein KDJ42_00040 [Alphaproteobacteria bacterium]|nr:hypothetical protein [Alphaproteobacteria bacterium]